MDTDLLWLPLLITAPAAALFVGTWGASALANRGARRLAARPRFTADERERLRVLKERYRREHGRR